MFGNMSWMNEWMNKAVKEEKTKFISFTLCVLRVLGEFCFVDKNNTVASALYINGTTFPFEQKIYWYM